MLREQDDENEPEHEAFTFFEVERYNSEENVYEKFINQPSSSQQRNQSEDLSQNPNDLAQRYDIITVY